MLKRVPERCTATGSTSRNGSLRHTGKSLDLFKHLSVVRSDLIWSIEALRRHRQAKREHVLCLNPEIDSREIPEAPQRKTTGRQQRQREGKLGNDKHAQSVASHST